MAAAHPRGRFIVLACLGATCLSAAAILITLAGVGPATAAFYRCALPLPVLAVLAAAEQRRQGRRRLGQRWCAALGGLFLAVNLVLWIHSIADLGAGVATVLGNLQVLFVAALAWTLLAERPGARYLLALIIVLPGVVLVSGIAGGGALAPHPAAGLLYGLGTSAAYACFLLLLRQTAGAGRHPAGQLFDATAGAAAGCLLLGLGSGGLQLAIPGRSLAWLSVLAVSSGIVGWLLITSSLPRLPASLSALLLLIEPAAAMLLAFVILHQRASLLQVGGAALVCGGALIAATGRGNSPAPRGHATPGRPRCPRRGRRPRRRESAAATAAPGT